MLGFSISCFRKSQNKGVKDVAAYCNVPHYLIQDIEANKVVVRKELLLKICECLNVPEDVKENWLSFLSEI